MLNKNATHHDDECLYPVKDEEGCQEVVAGLSSSFVDDDSPFCTVLEKTDL